MKAVIRQALFIALSLVASSKDMTAAPKEDGEIAGIKAVYIYHFASFAQWPAGASAQKEIRLCVLGEGRVSGQLQQLDGKDLEEDRLLRVVPVRKDEVSKACNMVYIGEAANFPGDAVWARLRSTPVLLVSDQTGFAQQGGMIEMFLRDDKIKMRINLGAVRSAGLSLSSKLLRLAEIIESP